MRALVLPWVGLVAVLFSATACAHSEGRGFNAPANIRADSEPPGDFDFAHGANAPRDKSDESGFATWYGERLSGHKTASGERFDPGGMTAAHRSLPLGTWVEVRRTDTGRTVRVRINDRGPRGDSRRIIDVSRAAAEQLGMIEKGTVRVDLRVVHGP